jgi:hypothetical protein
VQNPQNTSEQGKKPSKQTQIRKKKNLYKSYYEQMKCAMALLLVVGSNFKSAMFKTGNVP